MGRARDLSGFQFGLLTVVKLARISILPCGQKQKFYQCKCSCGSYHEVAMGALTSGATVSCGCYHSKALSARNFKHGMRCSPEYQSWASMITRCYNKNTKSFKNYGGRGINVCDSWRNDFQSFYQDMGSRPIGSSLDRIDVNGDYYKENCRWATNSEQARNRRDSRFVEFNGERKSLSEWSEILGIKYLVLYKRIGRGDNVERAFRNPSQSCPEHLREKLAGLS